MIVIRSNLLWRDRSKRQIRDRFMSYRLNAIASQMIELTRANNNSKVEELIDFNVNQGSLDYKDNSNVQHQDLLWLRVKNLVSQKEMLKPLSKKKKVQ